MGRPLRLDARLVQLGHAVDVEEARALILSGRVRVDGLPADKAARQLGADQQVQVVAGGHDWVGRGAHKLLGALADLPARVEGRVCADLGASTGGFTEVLLHHGAAKVYAIDVGHNLLAWRLRTDPRVVVMDGTNARTLDALPEAPELIVGDLSFISLGLILPSVRRLLAPGGEALLLVKPQFEAKRDAIAAGGRVRSEEHRIAAIAAVRATAEGAGFEVVGAADCRLPGAKAGNVEHFLWLRPA
jgi:23S rRNA (cytidine1920-2'-O)/16S rRNA (cytidine1409-2'-O)-methyltransferase